MQKDYANPGRVSFKLFLHFLCRAQLSAELGRTTIHTSDNPALLRNCADHPADCNPFQKCNPITTLNHDKKMN